MITQRNIYFLGYGGHALVINDCLSSADKLLGYFDIEENERNPLKIKYMGCEKEVDSKSMSDVAFYFPAVGSNLLRKKMMEFLINKNWKSTIIQHKTSVLSPNSQVDMGSLIGPNCVVNAFAKIGKSVIINSSAVVEHGCLISDYVHIAPGSVICGDVKIGEGSFIGAKSVIKEGISIGRNVVIGAGSVVLENVDDNETIAGIPAKKIK